MTSLSLFTFMHWRRKWQPTLVFLPGESQGWGSLVGCCLWGHTESDTTEATWQIATMRSIYLSILCYKELAHVIMEAEKSRTGSSQLGDPGKTMV